MSCTSAEPMLVFNLVRQQYMYALKRVHAKGSDQVYEARSRLVLHIKINAQIGEQTLHLMTIIDQGLHT